MQEKEEIVRLNADIPNSLKKRLKLYCVNEEMDIKEVVMMALENFLDEMEGSRS